MRPAEDRQDYDLEALPANSLAFYLATKGAVGLNLNGLIEVQLVPHGKGAVQRLGVKYVIYEAPY